MGDIEQNVDDKADNRRSPTPTEAHLLKEVSKSGNIGQFGQVSPNVVLDLVGQGSSSALSVSDLLKAATRAQPTSETSASAPPNESNNEMLSDTTTIVTVKPNAIRPTASESSNTTVQSSASATTEEIKKTVDVPIGTAKSTPVATTKVTTTHGPVGKTASPFTALASKTNVAAGVSTTTSKIPLASLAAKSSTSSSPAAASKIPTSAPSTPTSKSALSTTLSAATSSASPKVATNPTVPSTAKPSSTSATAPAAISKPPQPAGSLSRPFVPAEPPAVKVPSPPPAESPKIQPHEPEVQDNDVGATVTDADYSEEEEYDKVDISSTTSRFAPQPTTQKRSIFEPAFDISIHESATTHVPPQQPAYKSRHSNIHALLKDLDIAMTSSTFSDSALPPSTAVEKSTEEPATTYPPKTRSKNIVDDVGQYTSTWWNERMELIDGELARSQNVDQLVESHINEDVECVALAQQLFVCNQDFQILVAQHAIAYGPTAIFFDHEKRDFEELLLNQQARVQSLVEKLKTQKLRLDEYYRKEYEKFFAEMATVRDYFQILCDRRRYMMAFRQIKDDALRVDLGFIHMAENHAHVRVLVKFAVEQGAQDPLNVLPQVVLDTIQEIQILEDNIKAHQEQQARESEE